MYMYCIKCGSTDCQLCLNLVSPKAWQISSIVMIKTSTKTHLKATAKAYKDRVHSTILYYVTSHDITLQHDLITVVYFNIFHGRSEMAHILLDRVWQVSLLCHFVCQFVLLSVCSLAILSVWVYIRFPVWLSCFCLLSACLASCMFACLSVCLHMVIDC